MGLRINQNIAAQNAYRNLSVTDSQMSKSLEKLSSGFRINRAADDAAGLSISEGLRSQVGGLKVAVRNTQDGVSVAQTAEGALNETTAILQRMRDLSVQAANSGATDSSAAEAANKEMGQLNAELDRIGKSTAFGKQSLLDGTFGSTKQAAGTQMAATTSGAAASLPSGVTGSGTFTFSLEKVGGLTKSPNGTDISAGGTPIQVSVDKVAADASPQDLAKAVNAGLEKALKAAGFQGNEVTMSAKVDSQNRTTFNVNGSGDFSITNDTNIGVASSVDTTTGVNSGGLGVNLTTLNSTGGNTGKFQVGANANQKIGIAIGGVDSETLGTAALDLTKDPDAALKAIDKALSSVTDSRATLGAVQNRFEHTINNLNVAVENLSASESRIRDTDMAQEMVSFTRSQILTQAGTSMLSQANQSAQNVLSLLR
ncbi:flagellin [Paractinoplanes abujensis]|uniref:Flagellin n=1 Tax=Paractinoplanes abujensis TaxID=882441 RepID=A0A7W7CZW7_9ACTN|nr:flagellin [Actinoplanes abujensis]MBB4696590.1 flagellin [Actinoplanes abujensis]GID18945.1 flagellin [Actinoplanes abujensis]